MKHDKRMNIFEIFEGDKTQYTHWVISWTSNINPLINPLVNPVNTKGACSDKTYSYKIWNSVQRGFIPNFIFTALILTEILAEIVKLTH